MKREEVTRKVKDGHRISDEDALWLLTQADLCLLGELATARRAEKVGDRVYYQHNLNLNHTNVCRNECNLCAYFRTREEGYTLSVAEVARRVRHAADKGVKEVHIVGGLNEALEFGYYLDMMRAVKEVDPQIFIQAFTAVEIDFMAEQAGLSEREILQQLKDAGLGSLPGGGAEVFSGAVRSRICPHKIDGPRWLEVMETAHQVGVPSNATMLYGHVEKPEEIVDHLARLRTLQDRTGGFFAFVPLSFFSSNTGLPHIRKETLGEYDMRIIALARLYLDNFPHVKSLWMTLGYKGCQAGLEFGADDIGATYYDEEIVHSAGAQTPRSVSEEELVQLARKVGRTPVEVYSNYVPVTRPVGHRAVRSAESRRTVQLMVSDIMPDDLEACLDEGRRLTREQGRRLFDQELWWLGRMAHRVRMAKFPALRATFIVDRIVNLTNVCANQCDFCAYCVEPDDETAYVLSSAEVVARVAQLDAAGGTQVLLQGGLNESLGLDYYLDVIRSVKREFPDIVIHSLSPPEVFYLAQKEGLDVAQVLERLRNAGLASLPGGGAEILVDSVRRQISPRKMTRDQWLDVMRTAHKMGMKTTATMMFGSLESLDERLEHLDAIRTLQDETGGFRAFIPWTFCPGNTRLSEVIQAGGAEYLQMLAVCRLYLDNIDHIGSGWLTEGLKTAQLGLLFGADDMGGILMEENVVRMTGLEVRTNLDELKDIIRGAGFRPARRDTAYEILEEF